MLTCEQQMRPKERLGWVGYGLVFFGGLVTVIDWISRIEWVHGKITDSLLLSALTKLFLAPPPWVTLPAIGLGFGFIWWSGRSPRSPTGVPSPIWQTVAHVRAALGDNDFQNCYPQARAAIRKAAYDRRLVISGRREISGSQGNASALRSDIEPAYWARHELNAMAVHPHWAEHDHTAVEKGPVDNDRYWALYANVVEAQEVWPKLLQPVPSFEIDIDQTVVPHGGTERFLALTLANLEQSELRDRVLVKLEQLDATYDTFTLPLVLRTEAQMLEKRSGRFTLSSGETKRVPLLFRRPNRRNEWFMFDERGSHHFLGANEMTCVIAVYGGRQTARAQLHLTVGEDWAVSARLTQRG